MKYQDHLGAVPAELRDELAPLRTMEHVLAWMKRRGISLAAIEVITQDEFTHDATIPLGDGRWVAFGAT